MMSSVIANCPDPVPGVPLLNALDEFTLFCFFFKSLDQLSPEVISSNHVHQGYLNASVSFSCALLDLNMK